MYRLIFIKYLVAGIIFIKQEKYTYACGAVQAFSCNIARMAERWMTTLALQSSYYYFYYHNHFIITYIITITIIITYYYFH